MKQLAVRQIIIVPDCYTKQCDKYCTYIYIYILQRVEDVGEQYTENGGLAEELS